MSAASSARTEQRLERRATDRYLPLLALGFAGYMVVGKSFAYLGVPPLYVGEILFGLGILAFIASGSATTLFTTLPALCAVLLVGWVLLRTLQGVGSYGIDALRDGAVALYAGFAFIVAALLVERPARLAQIVGYFRIHARILIPLAILAYVIARFAGTSMPKLPWQNIEILSVRSGELAAHLCGALVLVLVGLCTVGRIWLVVALSGVCLVASQSRGGLLALVIPLVVAATLTGQVRRFFGAGVIAFLVLGAAYVTDVSIEIPRNERPISARALVDNMASIVLPNEANNLDGTKQWRLNWWQAIRNYTVHGPYFWTGKGFGVNLAEADGFVVGLEHGGPVLRSPHSVHMTYLARAGVPGLTLWLLTCATWSFALLRASFHARLTGEREWSRYFIFLVCYLAAMVIDASFDVALEGPMLGIPFWILFGVGLGSLMIYRARDVIAEPPLATPVMIGQRPIVGALALLVAAGLGARPTEAAEPPGCPKPSIMIPLGASIQAAVAASPPGTTFCIAAGVHRLQRIAPKDDQVFVGLPGAVLSGAQPVTNLRRQGAFWVTDTPRLPVRPFGTCLKSRPGCNDPLRFFLDDRPLEPVTSLAALKPGTVFNEPGTGKSYLADDPQGRSLESTRQAYAIWSNGARNVVVRGLVIEKYASPAQRGAVFGDDDARASGWTIEDNEVRLNSGAGIATGDGSVVRRNNVHHNGQLGISPNGTGVLIEDNEIHENNTHGFDAQWEAGGVKAGAITKLTLRRNNVHDNHGSGLWCDIDCRDIVIEGNTVERNADAGIFYEISFDAVIRDNLVRMNGTGSGGQQGSKWFWGAGIQVAASQGVQVYGNTVAVARGSSGIMLIDQARKRTAQSFYRTSGNVVRDNIVTYDGPEGMSGGASDVAPSSPNFGVIEKGGNRFEGNIYVFRAGSAPSAFIWGKAPISFDAFRSLGQEARGRLVLQN